MAAYAVVMGSGDCCNRPHLWRSAHVCATGQSAYVMLVCRSSWHFCIGTLPGVCVHVPQKIGFACSHWPRAVARRPQDTSLATPHATWLASFQCLHVPWRNFHQEDARRPNLPPRDNSSAALDWIWSRRDPLLCSPFRLFGGICFCWLPIPCAQQRPASTGWLAGWLSSTSQAGSHEEPAEAGLLHARSP